MSYFSTFFIVIFVNSKRLKISDYRTFLLKQFNRQILFCVMKELLCYII